MKALNASRFEDIPTFPDDAPNKYTVHAVIETPRDQRHKYAFESEYGIFALKTVISEGLAWPHDYGFIPGTLGEDGDPLDVLYLCDVPTFSGCLVKCRILGSVCLEKNGERNDRILAAALPVEGVAQMTDAYKQTADLPKELIDSVTRFLIEYSTDKDNKIAFKEVVSRKKALALVKAGCKKFRKKHRKQSTK